ncbi:STE20-related kinase adapter protein alpha isoform X2 [Hydra vulgaris]|nr:STE20-related kinase adapter protein alpha isoform X2 [Hydra vulgaris]
MIDCPGVLSFYHSFVKDEYIFTFFPLYNYGSCYDLLSSEFHHGLPIQLVAVVIRSTILALEYLHDFGIIHRAVKASHILLNSCGNVCLSGLSYSLLLPKENQIAYDYPKHAVQMLPWVSPEILQQNVKGYTYLTDIYSLGITIFELVSGTVPFHGMKPTEILLQKLCGVVPQFPDYSKSLDSQSDIVISQSSLDGFENDTEYTTAAPILQKHKRIKHLHQLVDACLQLDPSARPSAYQLHYCLYIRHVKRKQKEKDFPSFTTMLNPLEPVTKFIPADGSYLESNSPTIVSNEAWLFPS